MIRRKCVLHIMDGIKGVYQGGPAAVAAGLDVGEQRLVISPPIPSRWTTSPGGTSTPSARRRACRRSRLPAGLGLTLSKTEGFDIRQPQHIKLAANLGLGVFDFEPANIKRPAIAHLIFTLG